MRGKSRDADRYSFGAGSYCLSGGEHNTLDSVSDCPKDGARRTSQPRLLGRARATKP